MSGEPGCVSARRSEEKKKSSEFPPGEIGHDVETILETNHAAQRSGGPLGRLAHGGLVRVHFDRFGRRHDAVRVAACASDSGRGGHGRRLRDLSKLQNDPGH